MSRESARAPRVLQRPHRDTERVLAALQPGAPVGITRDGQTRWGEVVGVELDGIEVRYPAGDGETVVPWSASRPDRVTPAEIEVLP